MIPRRKEIAQTEINDFYIPRLADKNVFYLEIPVHNTIPMAIVQSTCDLPAKFSGLLFFQSAMRDNVIQHLTPIDILKKHVPVVIRSNNITHRTNIWMA